MIFTVEVPGLFEVERPIRRLRPVGLFGFAAAARGGGGARPGVGVFPRRVATAGQYPLLAVMVFFTVGGICLLLGG